MLSNLEKEVIIRLLLLRQYHHLLSDILQSGKLGDDTSLAELGSTSDPTAISINATLGAVLGQVDLALTDIQLLDGAHPRAQQALGQLDFNRSEDI